MYDKREYELSGLDLDYRIGILDWNTGLTDFNQKHTGGLSMVPEQHAVQL